MKDTKLVDNPALRNAVGDFISSYVQRDTTVDFSIWLADRIRQELPDLTPEASMKLTAEIMSAVAGFDVTLQELNTAVEAGQSKDEWFSDQLESIYQDMPMEAAGEALHQMESDLISSNMQIMGELDPAAVEGLVSAGTESVEWNKDSVKAAVYNIRRQVNMMILSAAANAMNRSFQDGESGGLNAVVKDALQGNLQSDLGEVKAVVAGAARAAAEKGLSDILPSDTPTEVIGNLAGAAVEGAAALCDAANGDISMTEALDQAGRAGTAAGCRIAAWALRETVANLPGASILVDLFGGLFAHMESPAFINDVYTTVKNTAIATWEGIKQSNIVQGIRRLGQELFN